jgi:hypothetical protein
MCDLTLVARSRRLVKELAETSSFKLWLNSRAAKLETTIRRKVVAKSKFLNFFYDQVCLHPRDHFVQISAAFVDHASQTRFEHESAVNLSETEAVGHRQILLKHVKKTETEIYDVKKGRHEYNEALPEELSPQRSLPKPPSLSLLCVQS